MLAFGLEACDWRPNWGRDQETDIRRNDWHDPHAGEMTLAEWIAEWSPAQDLEPRTANRYDYLIRTHLQPEFGGRPLNTFTSPEEIASWERQIPATEKKATNLTIRQATRLITTRPDPLDEDATLKLKKLLDRCPRIERPRRLRRLLRRDDEPAPRPGPGLLAGTSRGHRTAGPVQPRPGHPQRLRRRHHGLTLEWNSRTRRRQRESNQADQKGRIRPRGIRSPPPPDPPCRLSITPCHHLTTSGSEPYGVAAVTRLASHQRTHPSHVSHESGRERIERASH